MTHDPHPPHPLYGWSSCPTPPTALPGDEWTCPDCGRSYYAADTSDVDSATFEWVRFNAKNAAHPEG